MNMKRATGPAWQVRESARQELLKGVQRKIVRREDDLGRLNLYRIFLHLLNGQLTFSQSGISANDLSDIPWENREQALRFFCKVLDEIAEFQRSEEEGHALLAKLLEWVAGEIARPCYSALQKQEIVNPKLVYGVENATDEVPLE